MSGAAAGGDGAALDEFVDFSCRLADAAARVTTASFKDRTFMEDIDAAVESKSDASPVTFVDREAERQMRALIEERYPEHGIFGEEFGVKPPGAGSRFTWILDPIDGTKSFITGKPLYTTLVCLARDGLPVVGVIDQPVLGERWVGRSGRRTTMNGAEIATRRRARLADGYLYATTPHMFSERDGSAAAFERLRGACKVRLILSRGVRRGPGASAAASEGRLTRALHALILALIACRWPCTAATRTRTGSSRAAAATWWPRPTSPRTISWRSCR